MKMRLVLPMVWSVLSLACTMYAQPSGHVVMPETTNTLPLLDFEVTVSANLEKALDVSIRVMPKPGGKILSPHDQFILLRDETRFPVFTGALAETKEGESLLYRFSISRKLFDAGSTFWFIRAPKEDDPLDTRGYIVLLSKFPVDEKRKMEHPTKPSTTTK